VPALARRIVPVAVAATVLTGCGGDPGAPPLRDAGISVSPDAGAPGVPAIDAGIVAADAPAPADDAGR
jgi:hypothetical protein